MAKPIGKISKSTEGGPDSLDKLVDELNGILEEISFRFGRLAVIAEQSPVEATDAALADASTRMNSLIRVVREMGRSVA